MTQSNPGYAWTVLRRIHQWRLVLTDLGFRRKSALQYTRTLGDTSLYVYVQERRALVYIGNEPPQHVYTPDELRAVIAAYLLTHHTPNTM